MERQLIIKNIFSKIYISPLLYILIIVLFFSGKIFSFILFMSLILIHELGHTITAFIFKWKIDKICLYPYGGISKFNQRINAPLYQEFIILIMGPVVQMFFYLIIVNNLHGVYKEMFQIYNYFILSFNLLPIYPLDGGKLLNIIMYSFLPYLTSNYSTYLISTIISLLVLIYFVITKSIFMIIVLIFIIIKLISEYLDINYNFNKFLLERYLYN